MWNTNDEDTPVWAIFMRKKKVFENVETSVYSPSFDRRIDTPILAILYEKKSLRMCKRLYVARALLVGECGILTKTDTPILAIL